MVTRGLFLSRVKKSISVVAVMMFVFTGFEAAANLACATIPALTANDSASQTTAGNSSSGMNTTSGNSISASVPSSSELSPSLAIPSSLSGVQSYGSVSPVVSCFPSFATRTTFTNAKGNLTYCTSSGIYVVDKSSPQFLKVLSQSAVPLVETSCFVLKYNNATAVPINGRVESANEGSVIVFYELVNSTDTRSHVAYMEMQLDFSCASHPKSTVRVLSVNSTLDYGSAGWNVVWKIVLAADIGLNNVAGTTKLVSGPTGPSIVAPDQVATFELQGQGSYTTILQLNWSDAKSGSISVARNASPSKVAGEALEVSFSPNQSVIDPTIIANTSASTPTGLSFQRKAFSYGGYFWTFYDSGSMIFYRASADGVTWSPATALPNGTAVYAGSGFDVDERNGKVGIAWIDSTGTKVYFKSGVILSGKIVWDNRVELVSYLVDHFAPLSLAIGADGSYFVFSPQSENRSGYIFSVFRSLDGKHFADLALSTNAVAYGGFANSMDAIVSYGNGDLALIETKTDSSGTVRVRYWISSLGWTSPTEYTLDILYSEGKNDSWSVVAALDGTLYLAFVSQSFIYRVYCAEIETDQVMPVALAYSGMYPWYPSVCLDANGEVNLFVLDQIGNNPTVYHSCMYSSGGWSPREVVFEGASGVVLKGLAAWNYPVGSYALVWTQGGTSVSFACSPMPYGTPGTSTDAWDRQGMSPYGTYFSTNGDLISPGTGLLMLSAKDVSIPSRASLTLGISRVYMEPGYFRTADGTPYMTGGYPFCSLGQGWSLDLPWMDQTYVGIPGGQRFPISWGNEGEANAFVNHNGAQFTLRDVTMQGPRGAVKFYELVMASGQRFVFDFSTYKLTEISDLEGYDYTSLQYNDAINLLLVYYDASGRISSISEDWTGGKSIGFNYDANGNLWKITRPDSKTFTLGYTVYGGKYYLTSVSDPLSRVTSYSYSSSNSYVLSSTTFPTGGKNIYLYSSDATFGGHGGTELVSYLMQKAVVQNSTAATIRETDFDYKMVAGKVTFCRLTDKDSAGAIQGKAEYIFSSALGYTGETKKNSTGVQLSRSDTWYDINGQPVRIDTYKGKSQTSSYSEYTGYDDWGNVIFTRDALGHETYHSYANANTRNSFQGGRVLTRTNSGKIYYDAFDNWSASDWGVSLAGTNTVALDGSVGSTHAPALRIWRNGTSGNAIAYHGIGTQTGDFVLQASYMTDNGSQTMIIATAGGWQGTARIWFGSCSGYFEWFDGSIWQPIPSAVCAPDTWYDIGFFVHSATYDIYIDGAFKATATLRGSGNIDTIQFMPSSGGWPANKIWIDDIRVYKSLTITIQNAGGYVAELCDSNSNLICRTLCRNNSGSPLVLPVLPLNCPPGYVHMIDYGWSSWDSPIMDVWGGDTFTFSAGYSSTSLAKASTGYGNYYGRNYSGLPICDDWFAANYVYTGNEVTTWVSGTDYPVSGAWYQDCECSGYGAFYHGFEGAYAPMQVRSVDVITQYVWLTEGRIPGEIALEFLVDGNYVRAYWGSTTDMISAQGLPYPSTKDVWIGYIPQVAGRWLELTVQGRDLGIYGTSTVTGVYYAHYGGCSIRWDLTANYSGALYVSGLSVGMTVEFDSDDGSVASGYADTTQPVVLDLYAAGERTFPLSGSFKVLSGSTLLCQSPEVTEIYTGDQFQYASPDFYPNAVKGLIHDRVVGTFDYQDYGCTVQQKAYSWYDSEGNGITTKTWSGSNWLYSKAGYDCYGNLVWSSDQSNRSSRRYYSSSDQYVTLAASGYDGLLDTCDSGWARYQQIGTQTAAYSSVQDESPPSSIWLSIAGFPDNESPTLAMEWKSFPITQPLQSLSISMYLGTYYHDTNSANSMDSGIRILLYDKNGVKYATYSYWLACWSGNTNNKTSPDPTKIKVVYGRTTTGTWLRPVLHPYADFPSIDWTKCRNVTIELYSNVTYAYGDGLDLYLDDLAIDNFAANSKTIYTYDVNNRWLLTSTDPLGRRTNYSYDAVGRVTFTQYPDNNRTRSVYNDTLNFVSVYDELNRKTVNYYDSIGRLIKMERYGSGSTVYSSVNYSYNWQDKVSRFTNEYGNATIYSYDYLGRQKTVTFPGGASSTSTSYDDLNSIVIHTDELGHKTAQLLDNLGRHNSTWEYYTSSLHYWTNMTYDAVGNVVKVRDANGKFTNMTCNPLNMLIQTSYSDGRGESANYDNAGRVMCKWDRNGTMTSSTYDSAGHLIQISNPADTINYSYDAGNQVVKVVSNLGSLTYSYDLRGRLTALVETVKRSPTSYDTFTTKFGYDKAGNRNWGSYPDGVNISCAYDAFNRLRYENRTQPAPTSQFLQIAYNKDDTIATETYGHGTAPVAYYTYDSTYKRDWLNSIIVKNGSTVLSLSGYAYDAAGNVAQFTSLVGGTETYTYDSLNRLTKATTTSGSSFGTIKYGYDAVGNRQWINATGTNTTCIYQGYNQLNKTITGGTTFYNYDKDGNQIWKNQSLTTRYNCKFNSLNQLTQVVKWTYNSGWSSSTVGQYRYDANGQRATTNESGVLTEYEYLGHDPLCEKNGTAYSDYVYANGQLKLKLSGTSTYFYFNDAQGSPRLVLRWSGSATSTSFKVTTYAPFGKPIVSSGSEKVNYAGEFRDSVAGTSPGLYYIGARWMDPQLGRWLSLDPKLGSLSAPQSLDRYVYCMNDPLRYIDPTGESGWLSGLHHWWDKHWKEVAIVALCVAVVLTAGVAAPIALGVIGVDVSVSVSVASAFAGGAINAGFTYFSSGGKASFGKMMGSFVEGGIAGAFLPGIARAPTELGGGIAGRLVAGAIGGFAGSLGNLAGQITGNLLGGRSPLSINLGSVATGGVLGGALGGVAPGAVDFAKGFLGAGGSGVYSSFLERSVFFNGAGDLGAILNPLEHPCGAYFWGSTVVSNEMGLIVNEGTRIIGGLFGFSS